MRDSLAPPRKLGLLAIALAMVALVVFSQRALADNHGSVDYTFNGLDACVVGVECEYSIHAQLIEAGDANTDTLRWKATAKHNDAALADQQILYGDGFAQSFSTDASGVAWFGPAAGFPAAAVGLEAGVTTPFRTTFADPGDYEVTIQLFDVSDGPTDDTKPVGDAAVETFSLVRSVCDDGCSHTTIADAVAAASADETIEIRSSTVSGRVVIDKDLTIKGVGGSRPVITPSQSTGGSGDARGWFLVATGASLTLTDLEVDGEGFNIHQAIRARGDVSVQNVAFSNITYPGYQGMAIAALEGTTTSVKLSTFANIGRIGVIIFGEGSSGTIDSNTFTGKGEGDHLDYAVEIGGGATGTITNNTISGNRGVASSDSSGSAGILVTATYSETGPSGATIIGNEISDSSAAVAVGYNNDENEVTITGNTFSVDDETIKLAGVLVGDTDISGNIVNVTSTADIEDAIYGAGEGGTVNFAAGEYSEPILISHSVTLNGANAGIDPRTAGRGPETVFAGEGNGIRLFNDVSDVVIDGFELTDRAGTVGHENASILFVTGQGNDHNAPYNHFENVTVRNNIVRAARGHGVFVDTNATFDGLTISSNLFTNVLHATEPSGIKIQAGGTNLSIVDNVIATTAYAGILANNIGSGEILRNVVQDTPQQGIQLSGAAGTDGPVAIRDNIITNANTDEESDKAGIRLYGAGFGEQLVSVSGNIISDSLNGIAIADGNDISGKNIEITGNHLAGNSNLGIYHGGSGQLDATGNWWGHISGPAGIGSGTGVGVDENITFSPWLCSGTDTSGATGFQPTSELCPVTAPPGADPDDFVEGGSASGVVDSNTPLELELPSGGNMTATYDGDGEAAVFLGEYTDTFQPGDTGGFNVGDNILDVYVAGATNPGATLTVTLPCEAGDVLRYWNGSAWAQVTTNGGGTPTCDAGTMSVTFGATSVPRLRELTGTPIVSGDPTVIEVQIQDGPVSVGDTVTVDIVLKATDFQGGDITLSFDPNELTIGDLSDIVLWPNNNVVPLPDPDDPPVQGDVVQVSKTVNNTTGGVNFAFSIIGGSASGNDLVLAQITFTATGAAASASVGVESETLSDSDGFTITPVTVLDDDTITINALADVSGVVTLQGRANDQSAATVHLDYGDSDTDTAVNADGTYAFSDLATGQVTRVAYAPGYLRAVGNATLVSGQNIFPAVELLGGDANGDNLIDILDLSLIATHYQADSSGWENLGPIGDPLDPAQDQTPDINGDNLVDILDLSVTAANYGTIGASGWE